MGGGWQVSGLLHGYGVVTGVAGVIEGGCSDNKPGDGGCVDGSFIFPDDIQEIEGTVPFFDECAIRGGDVDLDGFHFEVVDCIHDDHVTDMASIVGDIDAVDHRRLHEVGNGEVIDGPAFAGFLSVFGFQERLGMDVLGKDGCLEEQLPVSDLGRGRRYRELLRRFCHYACSVTVAEDDLVAELTAVIFGDYVVGCLRHGF